jgi:hypothetical protein
MCVVNTEALSENEVLELVAVLVASIISESHMVHSVRLIDPSLCREIIGRKRLHVTCDDRIFKKYLTSLEKEQEDLHMSIGNDNHTKNQQPPRYVSRVSQAFVKFPLEDATGRSFPFHERLNDQLQKNSVLQTMLQIDNLDQIANNIEFAFWPMKPTLHLEKLLSAGAERSEEVAAWGSVMTDVKTTLFSAFDVMEMIAHSKKGRLFDTSIKRFANCAGQHHPAI